MEFSMSLTTSKLSRLAIAAALTATGSASMAQIYGAEAYRIVAAPGKDGGYAGVGVIGGMQYQGSDEHRTAILPTVEYQWATGWFAGVVNGVGYNFSKNPALQYGGRLTLDIGREEIRSSRLKGMGNIDTKAEVGGFFNYAFMPGVMLTSSLRTGSGNENNGTLLDVGLGYSTKLNDQWGFSTGAGLTWANDAYMQSYFGVSVAQAKTSGYRVYTPGSALRDARVRVELSYQFDPKVSITLSVASATLSDQAKLSPLVRKTDTVTGLLALVYAF
jgi:outer membrane scaffolding protein for murein synthesis (MipA/OmpV family)